MHTAQSRGIIPAYGQQRETSEFMHLVLTKLCEGGVINHGIR